MEKLLKAQTFEVAMLSVLQQVQNPAQAYINPSPTPTARRRR